MKVISAVAFQESAEEFNRFAKVVADASTDTQWSISINGTDSNGQKVTPRFITIDNFNNANPVTYSLDGFSFSSLAPYSITVVQINIRTQNLILNLTLGAVNVFISEKNLPVSPGVRYADGSGGGGVGVTKYQFVLSGANFNTPADWNNANNKIHCMGAGSSGAASGSLKIGGRGGGGGAYSNKANVALAGVIACQIGAGNSGTDTFVINAATVMAKAAPANSINAGTAAASVGDVKNDGGQGGTGVSDPLEADTAGGGGGGCGGPNASGTAGEGGGFGIAGGPGNGGLNGGGPTNGGNGTTWTSSINGTTAGPGGGGNGNGPNDGGNYGAGGGGGVNSAGGLGRQGLIVLEWTPA